MSEIRDDEPAAAELADAVTSIRATREDESTVPDRFNSESADVSDDELDQPDSRG